MKKSAIFQAVLAALCYGISVPASKLLLERFSPVFMASLLYLGAGIGMIIINILRGKKINEAKITKKELPFTAGMVALDIIAPIFLMAGLTMTTSANAALMNNFEIVATAVIALFVFKEAVGRRMWIAISLITLSSFILTFEGTDGFTFSAGSLLVLLACVCWGLENNCTRKLSLKDPLQIVMIKGIGSGLGSLVIAAVLSEIAVDPFYIGLALLLGFASYGLSMFLYIHAQRLLGAARTSAYYAIAPFIGAGLSFIIFRQNLSLSFMAALAVMAVGTYFAVFERHEHEHVHELLEHEHRHGHSDGHHFHTHGDTQEGEHSHPHVHEEIVHSHKHTPDLHHAHSH